MWLSRLLSLKLPPEVQTQTQSLVWTGPNGNAFFTFPFADFTKVGIAGRGATALTPARGPTPRREMMAPPPGESAPSLGVSPPHNYVCSRQVINHRICSMRCCCLFGWITQNVIPLASGWKRQRAWPHLAGILKKKLTKRKERKKGKIKFKKKERMTSLEGKKKDKQLLIAR